MARIVILGASLTDMNLRLERLPRPGETLLGGAFFNAPGGKGANQAVAASRAGGSVTFLTAFGDDDIGRSIRAHDLAEGIDLSFAKTIPGMSTGVALIMVGDDGENLIGVAMGANSALSARDIEELPEDVFAQGGVLLVSLEVPIEASAAAIKRGHAGGMTVVVNPAPADRRLVDFGLMPLIDVLTPNETEAAVLVGVEAENHHGLAELVRATGVKSVVLTLGGQGCLVVDAKGATTIPARRVNVVDTVGAGDAFNAALAVALAEGRNLVKAAAWASAAAAIAVTKPGAQGALPSRSQIEALANEPA